MIWNNSLDWVIRSKKDFKSECTDSELTSWLSWPFYGHAMSNINILYILSYPSDLYFKEYPENAAQVDYLSCSFRSVYWGLSLALCHAYLMGWHPCHSSVAQNKWFFFYLRPSPHYGIGIFFKCFPSTMTTKCEKRNYHQYYLCLSKTHARLSLPNALFSKCLLFIVKRKAGALKSSHFKTLSIRGGLVWTEGLAIEI